MPIQDVLDSHYSSRLNKKVLNVFLSTRIAAHGQYPLLKVFNGSITVLNGLNVGFFFPL